MEKVCKTFRNSHHETRALCDIDLHVECGEFLCIIGASGCGKTTLLNLFAGLDNPDLLVCENGREISGPSPHRVIMFQEPSLFPWLTVLDNAAFGLEAAGIPKSERRKTARHYIDLVHLADFRGRFVHELSGGMKQRVALARALCLEPNVLLMDEPFGALDAQTRDLLHEELQQIWRETGKTIVFVTHNVREALILGDRVVLMSARPGTILKEFTFKLPRPRHFEDAGIAEAARVVLADLRSEVLKAEAAARGAQ